MNMKTTHEDENRLVTYIQSSQSWIQRSCRFPTKKKEEEDAGDPKILPVIVFVCIINRSSVFCIITRVSISN